MKKTQTIAVLLQYIHNYHRRIKMEHHKITKEQDLIDLQEFYEDDDIFEILETKEEITIPDFRYNADWNNFEPVTIQHI